MDVVPARSGAGRGIAERRLCRRRPPESRRHSERLRYHAPVPAFGDVYTVRRTDYSGTVCGRSIPNRSRYRPCGREAQRTAHTEWLRRRALCLRDTPAPSEPPTLEQWKHFTRTPQGPPLTRYPNLRGCQPAIAASTSAREGPPSGGVATSASRSRMAGSARMSLGVSANRVVPRKRRPRAGSFWNVLSMRR